MDPESTDQALSMKEIVNREIGQCKQTYGEKWRGHYFNNFECNLPGGLYRIICEANPKILELDKYPGKNTREMFSDVDKAIEECGIDIPEIERLRCCDLAGLDDFMLPVYVRLREMGYTKDELFA